MRGGWGPQRNAAWGSSTQDTGKRGGGAEGAARGLTSDEDGGGNVGLSQHGLHHGLEVLERAASAALWVQQHQRAAGPGQHPIAVTWAENRGSGRRGRGAACLTAPWEGELPPAPTDSPGCTPATGGELGRGSLLGKQGRWQGRGPRGLQGLLLSSPAASRDVSCPGQSPAATQQSQTHRTIKAEKTSRLITPNRHPVPTAPGPAAPRVPVRRRAAGCGRLRCQAPSKGSGSKGEV